jgi:hypothetical protein
MQVLRGQLDHLATKHGNLGKAIKMAIKDNNEITSREINNRDNMYQLRITRAKIYRNNEHKIKVHMTIEEM